MKCGNRVKNTYHHNIRSSHMDSETLCQKIDKINLQYFGHIARRGGDNLEKIIALGLVEGKRKSNRQKLRLGDGIREITGLDVCTASLYAQDTFRYG